MFTAFIYRLSANRQKVRGDMTVGEVIALICKLASEKDMYLMAKSIYSIDVDSEGVCLYFTDANTENYYIKAESEEV